MESAVLRQWLEAQHQSPQVRASCRLTKMTSTTGTTSALDSASWKSAWGEYVRGNVVSQAAAKLIQ
eukprot:2358980-Pyramimonas_sp.AAC.1